MRSDQACQHSSQRCQEHAGPIGMPDGCVSWPSILRAMAEPQRLGFVEGRCCAGQDMGGDHGATGGCGQPITEELHASPCLQCSAALPTACDDPLTDLHLRLARTVLLHSQDARSFQRSARLHLVQRKAGIKGRMPGCSGVLCSMFPLLHPGL